MRIYPLYTLVCPSNGQICCVVKFWLTIAEEVPSGIMEVGYHLRDACAIITPVSDLDRDGSLGIGCV